jgi:hypothetical protein
MRRWWTLTAAAGAVVLGGVSGVIPRDAGLLHHVALPPLDLFADVRVLMAHATGHAVFWPALGAVVVGRTVLLALLLGGLDRTRVRLAAATYGIAALPALFSAWAKALGHALLFARAVWIGFVVLLVTVLVLSAAPWRAPGAEGSSFRSGLRAALREGLRAGVVLAYLGAVLMLGALVVALGGAATGVQEAGVAAVVAVPISAALTAVAVTRLRLAPAPQARPHRASGLIAAVTVLVVFGTASVTGFAWPWQGQAQPPEVPRPESVLLMSGIDSASGDGAILEIDPADLGFPCERTYYFSYAGPGDGQPRNHARCPITTGAPYREEHTFRPFAEQVDALVAQVEQIPGPLVIAGHSQGAWVAWQAAAQGGLEDVVAIVLVGPFPDNPGGYPARGEPGAGRVAGDMFRALKPVMDAMDVRIQPDGVFTHEVLAAPSSSVDIFAQSLPDGIRTLSVPALEDLVLMPGGRSLPGAVDGCPVPEGHADLPRAPALHRQVNAFLDGELPGSCRGRDVVRLLSVPFTPPPQR